MSERWIFADYNIARTPQRLYQYRLSLAYAFSTRFNARRLESPSHGIWGLILDDLVKGISYNVVVIPQLTISSASSIDTADAETSLKSDIELENKKERIPDFTGMFWAARTRQLAEHHGPLNFFRSIPFVKLFSMIKRGATLSKDFDIPSGFDAIPQKADPDAGEQPFAGELVNWHTLKLSAAVTLFHAELKRPASRRHSDYSRWRSDHLSYMRKAENSSESQSQLIFATEITTQSVITICAVGEWWKFRITLRNPKEVKELYANDRRYAFLERRYTPGVSQNPPSGSTSRNRRPQLPTSWTTGKYVPDKNGPLALQRLENMLDGIVPVVNGRSGPSDSDSDGTGSGADETKDQPIAIPQPPATRRSKKVPKTETTKRFHTLGQGIEGELAHTLRDALPLSNRWSGPVLLGTPASNQRLYLVRKLLKIEATSLEEHYAGLGALSPPSI